VSPSPPLADPPPAVVAARAAALDTMLADALAATDDLVGRLRLARDAVAGRIVFTSSLGLEDQALLHALDAADVDVDVVVLDTGRHFQETLDTLEASRTRYPRRAIRVLVPEAADVEALVARDGINGFRGSVAARKACCHVRKVVPLGRALAGASAWITGLRRGQSSGRAEVPLAEADAAHRLIKLAPLADWSLDRLEAYVGAHDVPVNALHARGYPSIGCLPCTRAVRPGEDIRAGRWWWEREATTAALALDGALDGQECGLHSPRRPAAAGPSPASAPAPLTVTGAAL
jgi:phosphoadenosine phosphosulfate reductase